MGLVQVEMDRFLYNWNHETYKACILSDFIIFYHLGHPFLLVITIFFWIGFKLR